MPFAVRVTNEWHGDKAQSLKFDLSGDPGLDPCTHMNTRLSMKSFASLSVQGSCGWCSFVNNMNLLNKVR